MTQNLRTARAWNGLRRRALTPRYLSEIRTIQRDRDEFLEGCRLLRIYGDTAMPGRSPQPQQLLLADMMAAGHGRNAVLFPRRSAKTTSLIALALGRACARPDYRVAVWTATSGKAGRARFAKDVAPHLERLGGPDKRSWPYKLVRSNGEERVEFRESGGIVQWLSSIDDLRGEAYDLVIIDEAGEPDPQKVVDALAAAMPTTDTRPGAQIVVAGTGGRYKTGNLLHDWLLLGRAGRAGIIEYSVDEAELTDAMLAGWEPTEAHPDACVKDLVLQSHPGVGGLTSLDSVRGNFDTLPLEAFTREYLGIFTDEGTGSLLIRPRSWIDAGLDTALPAPDHYVLGLACHPDGVSAAVVVAWRDADGDAHVMLDRHERGIDWVAPYLRAFTGKHALVYDSISAVAGSEVAKLDRVRHGLLIEKAGAGIVRQAAVLFLDELNSGRLHHYAQDAMTAASRVAVKRKVGMYGWTFGRVLAEDDITPLEAAALALRIYDDTPPPRAIKPMVAA